MSTLLISLKKIALDPIMILRFGAGVCFIGHGVLAISAKTQFVALLGSFGLYDETALLTLKVIGTVDVIVGFLLIFRPTKWILRWAVCWTALTVLAWGIHGDGLMDLFRRVTYITTPMALLILLDGKRKSATDSGKMITMIKPDLSTAFAAIEAIDLSLICMKLQEKEEGEGWTEQQCYEVAQEYRRYLKLKLLYPQENIVPNRAIDTMWHFHILDTAAYQRDCMAIFGQILHHYPYFGMHGESDEKQFFNSFDRTKMLYEQTFSVPMNGPGYLPSFQRAG